MIALKFIEKKITLAMIIATLPVRPHLAIPFGQQRYKLTLYEQKLGLDHLIVGIERLLESNDK